MKINHLVFALLFFFIAFSLNAQAPSLEKKKWFLEHQTLLSSNRIQNFNIALGKQVYGRDKHGLEVLAGLSVFTGLSSHTNIYHITQIDEDKMSLEREEIDLKYLIDATIGAYYTLDINKLQVGIGTKLHYGIFNNNVVTYSRDSKYEGGPIDPFVTSEYSKTKIWDYINRVRFGLNIKTSYRLNKKWSIGASLAHQFGTLNHDPRTFEEKDNTPLLLGAHLEYIIK